jgi:hypothetical protein
VTGVGVLLLSNLAKTPETAPTAAPVQPAINTEAVFTAVPREPSIAEPDTRPAKAASMRAAVTPKQPPALAPLQRKLDEEAATTRQLAATQSTSPTAMSVPSPLPTVQVPQQPQPAAATADSNSGVMSKLRSATAAVRKIPQWAASSVSGWFSPEAEPPRPPAAVPTQNFQASM